MLSVQRRALDLYHLAPHLAPAAPLKRHGGCIPCEVCFMFYLLTNAVKGTEVLAKRCRELQSLLPVFLAALTTVVPGSTAGALVYGVTRI